MAITRLLSSLLFSSLLFSSLLFSSLPLKDSSSLHFPTSFSFFLRYSHSPIFRDISHSKHFLQIISLWCMRADESWESTSCPLFSSSLITLDTEQPYTNEPYTLHSMNWLCVILCTCDEKPMHTRRLLQRCHAAYLVNVTMTNTERK